MIFVLTTFAWPEPELGHKAASRFELEYLSGKNKGFSHYVTDATIAFLLHTLSKSSLVQFFNRTSHASTYARLRGFMGRSIVITQWPLG